MQFVPRPRLESADSRQKSEQEFLVNLGQRVRTFREGAKLTRKRLAAMADVSERYLGQLEAGEGNISIILLRRVADAVGTNIPELLRSEQEALAERLVRRFLRQVPANQLEDLLVRLAREVGPEGEARRHRVALIGMRGAGKSSVGERYARELNVPFVELDREVEREAGLPLSELFLLYGQAGYRRLERLCLERVLGSEQRAVIAVGGGIVGEPDTYQLLLAKCLTVWLRASPNEHMQRVVAQGDLRPMARSAAAMEELEQLLKSREPEYRKADISIDTSGQSIDAVLARLRLHVSKS